MLERLKGSKPSFVMGSITYLEDEFMENPYHPLEYRAFEWGSGGSTIWLSQRTKSVITLEHDREWLEKAQGELDKYGIINVSLVLRQLDRGYVEHIDGFPNEHFDIIMVDGRRRGDCLKRAMPKLRSGGAMVLDDSQRDEYQEAMKALRHWQRMDWDSGYTEGWSTTVWRKPE
jgi:predicted O-methyltransferase YrrM